MRRWMVLAILLAGCASAADLRPPAGTSASQEQRDRTECRMMAEAAAPMVAIRDGYGTTYGTAKNGGAIRRGTYRCLVARGYAEPS